MKKLLLAFICISASATAQPVIQSTNLLPIGFSCDIYGAAPVTPGPGGANQTWNFSSSVTSPAGTFSVVAPGSTPCSGMFSSSNWSEIIPGPQYSYYISSSTQLEVIGENWSPSCSGGISYSNSKIVLQFPFNYNNTVTDPYVNTNGSYTNTTTYDGYGTLITPTATYSNVARIMINDGTSIIYEWISTGNPAYPLMLSQTGGTAFFENPLMGINNVEKNGAFTIYPNPSNGEFMVETSIADKCELNIFDVCGQLVSKKLVSGNEKLDLKDLSVGIYTAELKNGTETSKKKLVISH